MYFNQQTPLDTFLTILFDRYREQVPAVNRVTGALIAEGVIGSQDEIVNDHIAFRTLGVPQLGIQSFEKIFLAHGYEKRDYYYFETKKLNAYWYAPPSAEYPRIFISELIVDKLSDHARQIIRKYTDRVASDPVLDLNLHDGQAVGEFFHRALWPLPGKADYEALLEENEYAAWVIYNRYYLNHYTISVHELKPGYNKLEDFNRFVTGLGIRLNSEGGTAKVSPDGLLKQSSTVAELQEATFSDGETMPIAGSYVEFAERLILPAYRDLPLSAITRAHRREGFETGNADKIFESTYTKQTRS